MCCSEIYYLSHVTVLVGSLQDRRRQVEFVKMERQHERQQAVLRRKAEHAAAANKRLKEALAKQQSAADERAKALERQAGTMQERIKVSFS